MANDILTALKIAEQKWRKMSPEWNRKLLQFEDWKKRSKDRERQAERIKKQKKDADEPVPTPMESWESSFDPDDPSPQFSFAGDRTSYSRSDLEKDLHGLARWSSAPDWAIEGIRRGIAVHHSGMNKRYRSLVERRVIRLASSHLRR
jgi:hypothetical protein